METIFIHILYEKTIQNGILPIGLHLISFKNFYCYVSTFKSNAENAHKCRK